MLDEYLAAFGEKAQVDRKIVVNVMSDHPAGNFKQTGQVVRALVNFLFLAVR
jgi:hypothetical protein